MPLNKDQPTDQNSKPKPKPKPKPRWRFWVKLLLSFIGVLVLVILAFLYWLGLRLNGFMPPEMAAAQHTPVGVVGDLGGMPVRIPRHIPRFLEYEGDPGWGEKRRGPVPVRTHQSRITSFGFTVRYPDLATLSSPEMWADKEKYTSPQWLVHHAFREGDPWIDGGIRAGSGYGGPGGLNVRYGWMITPRDPFFVYEKTAIADPQIKGLELFVRTGTDAMTGEPNRFKDGMGDYYFHRDASGQVLAHIRCRYLADSRTYSSCSHDWEMDRHGVKSLVQIEYIPSHLKDWKDIQARVTEFILGFRDPDVPMPQVPTVESVSGPVPALQARPTPKPKSKP